MARAGYRFFLKIKKKRERKEKREVKATWRTRGIIPIPVVAYAKFTCPNTGMRWLSFLKLEWFSLILCFDFSFWHIILLWVIYIYIYEKI